MLSGCSQYRPKVLLTLPQYSCLECCRNFGCWCFSRALFLVAFLLKFPVFSLALGGCWLVYSCWEVACRLGLFWEISILLVNVPHQGSHSEGVLRIWWVIVYSVSVYYKYQQVKSQSTYSCWIPSNHLSPRLRKYDRYMYSYVFFIAEFLLRLQYFIKLRNLGFTIALTTFKER